MNRRRFIQATAAAVVGVAVAPDVALTAAQPNPQAFTFTRELPRTIHYPDGCRMDILYGYAVLSPTLSCRIVA